MILPQLVEIVRSELDHANAACVFAGARPLQHAHTLAHLLATLPSLILVQVNMAR